MPNLNHFEPVIFFTVKSTITVRSKMSSSKHQSRSSPKLGSCSPSKESNSEHSKEYKLTNHQDNFG